MLVDFDDGPPVHNVDVGATVLGIRFGMTGRPYVDDATPFALEYGASRDDPSWDRFILRFTDGGTLRINDPRRLGGIELDPDLDRIGPDALSLTLGQLRGALGTYTAPVKAVLLDQTRIGGLGNLLADEVLFRSGIDPARPAGSLADPEVRALHRAVRRALPELLELGGSHLGEFASAMRHPGARCPRDDAPMVRRTIGGRTSYSCPKHQR